MFYSLIQQLLRQDPVWYALMVAARPDNCWRLISYPYTAKYALQGDSTGFLHLDLNMQEYISSGCGANTLSSSISLDPEDDQACTLVVPGFHKHIREWHQRRVHRGDDSAGATTNCNTQGRRQDRAEWGHPVPRPCPAYGLRLTRPEIIHGSTRTSDRPRRVIYTWLTGILPDHLALENPRTLDWQQVADCHRGLEAPSRGVGGDIPTHSLPPFRFPASIVLPSSYPLGDALIGRRKWDDPEVLSQRDILLGPDHHLALTFVKQNREKMVKKFLKVFNKLESIERNAFSQNSFFLHHERHSSNIKMQ
jgi:hypothetical protein